MALADIARRLRCPETRQRLAVAPPELLQKLRAEQAAGRLFCKSGKFASGAPDEGLVREDGLLFYPVVGGIPVMLVEEAIAIAK